MLVNFTQNYNNRAKIFLVTKSANWNTSNDDFHSIGYIESVITPSKVGSSVWSKIGYVFHSVTLKELWSRDEWRKSQIQFQNGKFIRPVMNSIQLSIIQFDKLCHSSKTFSVSYFESVTKFHGLFFSLDPRNLIGNIRIW